MDRERLVNVRGDGHGIPDGERPLRGRDDELPLDERDNGRPLPDDEPPTRASDVLHHTLIGLHVLTRMPQPVLALAFLGLAAGLGGLWAWAAGVPSMWNAVACLAMGSYLAFVAAGQNDHAKAGGVCKSAKGRFMLAHENFRRRHQRRLTACFGGARHSEKSDNCFA